MKERLYKYDNLKFILIFLVVFGHFLEKTPGFGNTCDIYKIIYSFHMPAFIFISGYFARFNPRKIFTTYFWPYVLLQIAFNAYVCCYIEPSLPNEIFHFTYPYWTLWYLVAMVTMHMLIPFFDTKNKYLRLFALCLCAFISLYCGYENAISTHFALSKTLVFLPFFVLGYYCKNKTDDSITLSKKARNAVFAISLVLVILCSVYLLKNEYITYKMLHGMYPYINLKYNHIHRAIILIIGLIWVIFLTNMPFISKKIPIVSYVGQHTFPIFVFHGFFILFIAIHRGAIENYIGISSIWAVIALTLITLLLFGNSFADRVFRRVFTPEPLLAFVKKKLRK